MIDQMLDVLELAIKCGRVQVATLMLHQYDFFNIDMGFLPGITAGVAFHEGIQHADNDDARRMKLIVNRWFGERILRFLSRLDVIEDPTSGTTFLDNSLILWGNDQGSLQSCSGHLSENLPIMLAGSAGGFLATGKYVEYGVRHSVNRAVGANDFSIYKRGRPYNQLLTTIAQSMGLAPADYETGGEQGFGPYNQSKLNNMGTIPGNVRRDPLPLITKA